MGNGRVKMRFLATLLAFCLLAPVHASALDHEGTLLLTVRLLALAERPFIRSAPQGQALTAPFGRRILRSSLPVGRAP